MASVLFQPMSATFYSDSVGALSEAPSTFGPLSLEHLFPSPQVQLLSRHHPGMAPGQQDALYNCTLKRDELSGSPR